VCRANRKATAPMWLKKTSKNHDPTYGRGGGSFRPHPRGMGRQKRSRNSAPARVWGEKEKRGWEICQKRSALVPRTYEGSGTEKTSPQFTKTCESGLWDVKRLLLTIQVITKKGEG